MRTVRFTNPKQITQKNVESLSKKSAGVYKIVDKNNDVLYVGKAKAGRLGDRIYEHKGRFQGGTNFRVHETGTVEKAERLEKQIIKSQRPPRNKMLK